MVVNFLLTVFLIGQAFAGTFSQAEKFVYFSDVVAPSIYQNFVLTASQKPVFVTPLQCSLFKTDVFLLKNQVDYLKKQIKRSKAVFIEVPSKFRKVMSFYFGSYKNVHIRTRPVPYVLFRFCREVKK